jgi:hypothetical protein
MQFESMTVAAKRVRQNDVCARINKLLMQRHHTVWMVGDPKLWWLTSR